MKKSKRRNIYIHTIDNRPACFYPGSGRICFVSRSGKNYPATSLAQIRREQKITFKFRKDRGFDCNEEGYGYRRYTI